MLNKEISPHYKHALRETANASKKYKITNNVIIQDHTSIGPQDHNLRENINMKNFRTNDILSTLVTASGNPPVVSQKGIADQTTISPKRKQTFCLDNLESKNTSIDSNLLGHKVISYCIFGDKSYDSDLKTVLKQAKKSVFYRSWYIYIFYEGNINKALKQQATEINSNVRFCDVRSREMMSLSERPIQNINGRIWRFIPMADFNVNVTCVRDMDSDLTTREEGGVREWLGGTEIFHVMRDFPAHTSNIMGGLWCFRNFKDRTLGYNLLVEIFKNAKTRVESLKSDDQTLLNKFVWPIVKADTMQHDSYSCKKYPGARPFPNKRANYHFVGCIRPCGNWAKQCPIECRPPNHKYWRYC